LLALLHTIWQADGTFPSGSFAFSYGVEGAAALGRVSDKPSLLSLVATILQFRWATFDRVALLQAYRASMDLSKVARIDHDVEASTFGDSMRTGSRRNGGSFLASHSALGNDAATALRLCVRRKECLGHIAVMQGAVWPTLGMDERLVQFASGYMTASGIASAAVRLGVVGALQAQGVVSEALPLIETLVAREVPEDARLSSGLPFLDIASARQAQASLRLFAN
jgi:urease accessory protein